MCGQTGNESRSRTREEPRGGCERRSALPGCELGHRAASVRPGCHDNTPGPGRLGHQAFPRGPEAQPGSGENPLLACRRPLLAVSVVGAELRCLSLEGHESHCGPTLPAWPAPHHLPGTPPPNPATLGARASTYDSGGHDSLHTRYLEGARKTRTLKFVCTSP